jgi:hypothetical protein
MEYRLYFFVPYNISDIQKGIQAGHAALEYAREYGHTQEYVQFIENDKTWVILNGGTTRDFNDSVYGYGSLDNIWIEMNQYAIANSTFREVDLNYALTAICFLADERVWNKEKYPDFEEEDKWDRWCEYLGGEKNAVLRNIIKDKHLA